MNKLDQLKKMTKVVADTSDFKKISAYQPIDATTNPSLLFKAAKMDEYISIVEEALSKSSHLDNRLRVDEAMLDIAVTFGIYILNSISGRVSTEVDARLSFNTIKTVEYSRRIINKYHKLGVNKSRILIKIPATWEGIKAAQILEKEDINCNLTLIFNITQAVACAQAKVFLVSPFVGRITDWYMDKIDSTILPRVSEDKGVLSVKDIYGYYKQYEYPTIIMGASFRHVSQVESLSGCDALTISLDLLQQLKEDNKPLIRHLSKIKKIKELDREVTENKFRWDMNKDPMATEKLAEGIRQFAVDTIRLEELIKQKLGL